MPHTSWLGLVSLLYILIQASLLVGHVDARSKSCKSTPDDKSWPSIRQWSRFNESLSGRLLRPPPPASACHSADLNSVAACADINISWRTFAFHQNDPVSTAWNNMNNDSCLPNASAPCSGLGYPVYVVNATSAHDVKLAIDFATKNNIRLNVKASGHDYLKRSASPFSLSIWTRYMVGDYELHDHFKPKGCDFTIQTTAVTAGAASYVSDIYSHLDKYNQTVVDGMGPEVTMGGYLTGGGHSPISNIYGLGSDQVYELEMVTPRGDIIIANECQNRDLFWAVRGGGGSTFGVLTKVTVRTLPSHRVSVYVLTVTAQPDSVTYWDVVTYLLAQFPTIAESNIAAYTYIYPYPTADATGNGTNTATCQVVFALYNPASDNSLTDVLEPYVRHINQTYRQEATTQVSHSTFSNFYSMFLQYADDGGAGVDKVVGSWLLPPDTLEQHAFRDALKTFMGPKGGRLYMVSGKGVWNAKPRGGSDATNPAWRKALIHAVTSQNWTPLDGAERATVEHDIDKVQVEAFRQLVPDSGAYLNEAYWNEPNFQRAFWGENYERLRTIKKAVDPDDVFWCHVCVGSESWEEVGDHLCRV